MTPTIDRSKRVVGIGSNVVDILYRVNRIAGPEEKTYILFNDEANVVKEVIGGVTLNHLAWANLLGVPSGLFGFQGDDRYGNMIRSEMDRREIDRSAIRIRPNASSSFSVVNVAVDANRAIYMARAQTGTTTRQDIERYFADYIRFSGMTTTEISQLPLEAVIAVLEIARDAGVTTVLDVDVPPDFAVQVARLGTSEEFDRAIGLADVVKPAKAAAEQMVEASTPEDRAVRIMDKYGSRLVAITDGERGCVITDGTHTARSPAYPIRAKDSTGAGDAFLGGLVAALYNGLSVENAARLANACGAVCCAIDGAFPLMDSSLDDVRSFYDGEPLSIFRRHEETSPEPVKPRRDPGTVGLESVRLASEALQAVYASMTPTYYNDAVRLIRETEACGGRVHVTGVGKPRHIAHKLAATLQSTGTRAYFLDPVDCNHGDSGQVAQGDVVIAISHSGKTGELLDAVHTVKNNGAKIVVLTGNADSELALLADAVLVVPVNREAGPLGLAPTLSTTCQMAVGDGLAMALKVDRGFTAEDFRKYHPAGSLGKMLDERKKTR
ncbi:MAG: SIS domain-containing protein [candidate division Zixibacteria bacterium]|nr:SIS domain-containing protein [candidate division Zixibacteria bacterium]